MIGEYHCKADFILGPALTVRIRGKNRAESHEKILPLAQKEPYEVGVKGCRADKEITALNKPNLQKNKKKNALKESERSNTWQV